MYVGLRVYCCLQSHTPSQIVDTIICGHSFWFFGFLWRAKPERCRHSVSPSAFLSPGQVSPSQPDLLPHIRTHQKPELCRRRTRQEHVTLHPTQPTPGGAADGKRETRQHLFRLTTKSCSLQALTFYSSCFVRLTTTGEGIPLSGMYIINIYCCRYSFSLPPPVMTRVGYYNTPRVGCAL